MTTFLLGAVAGYCFAQAEAYYGISKKHTNGWLLAVALATLMAAC